MPGVSRRTSVRAAMLVALVLAAAACRPPRAELDGAYAQAEQALRRGALADVISLAEQGASRAEAGSDPARAWDFRLLAAEAHASLLEMAAANAVLDATIPDGAPFDRARVRQQVLRARVVIARGDLKQAEALVGAARASAAAFPEFALELGLLEAQVLYRTGRAGAADALLQDLGARARTLEDPYRHALVLNTTGMGLVTRSRFDEALRYFEQVLALPGVEGTTVHGGALNNAGMCLSRLGEFDRAIALQERAVAVQAHARRQEYMQALGELGSTFFLKGETARGMQAWREALRIAAEGQLTDEAVLWARNLATAAAQGGDWDAAEQYNTEASRWAGDVSGSRKAYALVTTAQIAAGRGRPAEARRLYEEALASAADVPAVEWTAHDGLARLAVAERRAADATRNFERALATVERTRSALLRADSRISFTSRLVSFYRGYVEFLLAEGRVERALEVADSSRARVLAERQGTAAPTARVAAGGLRNLARQANVTLVLYALGPARSWMWTVDARGIRVTPLPPGPEIEALVAQHQDAIQNALADPLATSGGAGDRLFAALVAPLAATLPPDASLVIVPDGALHRLNFETLPVPSPARHYWIEDVTVQIAPSLAMLRPETVAGLDERRAGRARPRSLLLVGNASARSPEFPALTHAPAEMRQIGAHFPSEAVAVLDGERASPAAFTQAEPGRFSMIHFTSHAVANIENPLDSAVILSGPPDGYKLYARDVAALPLTADLVTVSACRSAGERAYAGEGLVGFAWAFLRAGSRRVVAGLWDVDDRSTATLMADLYRGLASGATPAEALREAKRALIRTGYPKPYYWAPFQVFTVVL